MTTDNRRQRRNAEAVGRQQPSGKPKRLSATESIARGRAMISFGQFSDAFELFAGLASAFPADPAVQTEFGWFLVDNTPVKPHPEIDPWLIKALDQHWIRPDHLAAPIARYLSRKASSAMTTRLPSTPSAFLDLAGVAALARDPLLLALLRATPAATPPLELFLARMRRACLAGWRAGRDIGGARPFLAALAIRGQNSGFTLTLAASEGGLADIKEEQEEVRALRAEIEMQVVDGDIASTAVALLGCYETIAHSRRAVSIAATDPALASLHANHVTAPVLEAEIARALVPQTPFDPTTARVVDQYEQHPYPLWTSEPVTPVAIPRSVAKALGPAGRNGVRSVLVAGCGTGQHAITAFCRWPRAQISAIDGSRASLAHAIRKVDELGLSRISFALADLLAIGELEKRYSVIEAVGVLHHLADPGAGLAALVDVLSPGGVLLIGLYARAARRRIAPARTLAEDEWPTTADAIRRFRARALVELDAPEITYSPDFYSVGGCRDLLFHAREAAFTLPEIQSLLSDHRMTVLAIETPPFAAKLLDEVPGPHDIEGWSAAESAHPTLFGAMYQVWIVPCGDRVSALDRRPAEGVAAVDRAGNLGRRRR